MTSFTPEAIDLGALPSVALTERSQLPNLAAIYFVLSAAAEVLYIGRAQSLCFRWQNHHQLGRFQGVDLIRIAWLTCTESSMLPDIEKAMITYFQPPYNRRPGPKPKGVVRCDLTLTPDLIDWAMSQPEGASALVRQLLAQERRRRTTPVGA